MEETPRGPIRAKPSDDRSRAAAALVTNEVDIARIVKVNHAGEYGAIRIYRAQIWVARRLFPDVLDFLEETLRHEIKHCATFREAMPARRARPCRMMSLWASGGLLLGFLTSLTGRRGIWICTAAVEGAVHRHLDDQLFFIRDLDRPLFEAIRNIQCEEAQHLSYAVDRIGPATTYSRTLSCVISAMTDLVIWLSTQGASTRMARELRAARFKS